MHEKTFENYANLQRNKLISTNQISPKFKRKKNLKCHNKLLISFPKFPPHFPQLFWNIKTKPYSKTTNWSIISKFSSIFFAEF